MGTGPATQLASMCKPYALMLMSAYTTIKAVAQNMVGRFIGALVQDHFSNLEKIALVQCPVMFIHGMQDPLIPCAHSEQLYQKLLSANPDCKVMGSYKEFSYTKFPKHMTHNDFDLESDIFHPMLEWLHRITTAYYEPKYVQPIETFEKI